MNGFTDVQIFPDERTLFLEEINALMLLTHEILGCFEKRPTEGSIVIYGQKKGEEPRKIMQMNLENGVAMVSNDNHMFDRYDSCVTTDKVVEISAVKYAREMCRQGFAPEHSGTYYTRPRHIAKDLVLLVNTTNGRFVIGAQVGDNWMNAALMYGIAVALANMGKEDLVLQQSIRQLMKYEVPGEAKARCKVEDLLLFCNMPELKVWKEWHEAAMAEGEGLALYFG